MKALKSKIAQAVLADPRAREQLRRASVNLAQKQRSDTVIEVRLDGRLQRFRAELVPKAA
ncbi:MAG TPA: hypothetical protein VNO84_16720 [Burkholderiaceae bacterium]|nr:hypothetical protein [Burkholderiaceae bacterium]